jgi:sugar phosphate isomerase/epimerase
MIYISTAGIKNQAAWKTSTDMLNSGICNIELSGGSFDEDQLKYLKQLKNQINFQIHNYFPPPKNPFVFNLASLSPDIAQRSLDHVETAMQFSLELNCPRYGFHGGFLFEPEIAELGKVISSRTLYNRHEAKSLFIERVNFLSDRASSLGISLLIENNVLSSRNFNEFNCNPFLMVDAEECLEIMNQTPSNVNLLVDVAHLKVSSKSLKFDPELLFKICNKWILAYHLSDNDGTQDNNETICEKSWFWPYLKLQLDYYSLEVYSLTYDQLVEQLSLTNNFFEKNNART